MKFLVFEGLDGSGKSTLIERLAQHLRNSGESLVLTREPGGTALAEEIREILLCTDSEAPVDRTEVLLYAASRAQHVETKIKPALKNKQWVLCDRFTGSTVAFQAFARGLSRADIDWINQYAINGTLPDLNILLDLTVEESSRRRSKRNSGSGSQDDRLERESEKFHESVREGYLAQAKESPERWLVLDAKLSPDELFKNLLQNLESRGWLKK